MDGNLTSHALCMVTTQFFSKTLNLHLSQNRILGSHHSHALSINDHDSIFKMSKFQQKKILKFQKNLNMHSSQKRLEIERNGRNLGAQAM